MSHRASYWKTTGISFAVTAMTLSALGWLISSRMPLLLEGLMLFPLVAGLIAALLIASGGLVCLWRDARDAGAQGDILARSVSKAPPPGLVSKLGLRSLLGAGLRPGDCVRVRTLTEISATLDADGALEGLPFMPEMHAFCGKVLRVHRRIDKINDMRHKTGLRRVDATVTLTGVRCSGSAHGGCQAECQILWKDRWLARLPARELPELSPQLAAWPTQDVEARAGDASDDVYVCQMTRLWEASHPMSSRDFRQDLRPLLWGNVGAGTFLLVMLTRLFRRIQSLRGGAGYPFISRSAASGATPSADSQLAAQQAVVVRSREDIAQTLVNARNKGLWFDPDMLRYCGRPAVVRRRVERVIHESTGKMVVMKRSCICLEEVLATGEFLRLCSQHEYILWREIWLRRAEQEASLPAFGS